MRLGYTSCQFELTRFYILSIRMLYTIFREYTLECRL